VFLSAVECHEPAARAALLDRECATDAELRRRVEALLTALDHPDSLLDQPIVRPAGGGIVPLTGPEDHGGDRTGAKSTVGGSEGSDPTVDHAPDAGSKIGGGESWVMADRRVRALPDYEILGELGRGGMGVVYKAHQISLNRPVALKMIKAGVLADDAELRRFQNEAEAVALLDHPGVVPIYEVGEHNGQPYFSMKLVEGGNLADQLPLFKDDPRAAATLLAEVAEAVHHAHMRGILHRDLKPANILVDAEGHPHVTDFGLAKWVETDIAMTQSGAILGTPAYMSPEQAEGHHGTITTATDVYGLGAILYALLTGQAPFGGDSIIETLDAVRSRPPAPPTRQNAGVPRDLETICLKCLEKNPRRRYASAQALADDVRAWIGSRPIAARRVGAGERAWLWCRRKPGVAALAATVLLAVVGGTATVIAVQARANAELKAANVRDKQRFNLAMDAIKLFHGDVSEDLLMKEKQFDGLRTKLLKGAADFYGRLEGLLEDQTDRESRAALGKAYHALGDLTGKIGDQTSALAVYRKAIAVRRALASEPGSDARTKLDVAWSLYAAGELQRSIGDLSGARESFEDAERLAEGVEMQGGVPEQVMGLLGTVYEGFAAVLSMSGDPSGALAAYSKALPIWQRRADANPESARCLSDLAGTTHNVANILNSQGRTSEALAMYERARSSSERAVRIDGSVTQYQLFLANHHFQIGTLMSQLGDPAGARVAYNQGLAIRQKLADANPNVTLFQKDLARGHRSIGLVLSQTGDPAGARAAYDKMVAIQQKLADANPRVAEFQADLAGGLYQLAGLLSQTGDSAGALTAFGQALSRCQRLVDANPSVPMYRNLMATVLNNTADVFRRLGRNARALEGYDRAVAIRERLEQDHPQVAMFHTHLAWSLRRRGLARLDLGDLAGAAADTRRALEILDGLPTHSGEEWFEIACGHAALGALAGRAGSGVSADLAPTETDKAVALLKKAVDMGYRSYINYRDESALDGLRDRPDFRLLMMDLAMPADPFGRCE